jgi:polyhydroxyalkanoate synthesis repressor PhaR
MSFSKNTIFIKKYENRRLYNINEKKYISLEDVRDYINNGYDIEVTEKKTGENITRQVLLQVIIDMSPEKLQAFPIVFLKFLIKSDAGLLNDYFTNFFTEQLGLYLNNRDAYFDAMKSMKGNFFGSDKGSDMFRNAFSNFFGNPFKYTKEKTDKDDTGTKKANENTKSNDDIDELKAMMEKMAKKLSDLEKKK